MKIHYHATVALSMFIAALCAASEPARSQEPILFAEMPVRIEAWQALSAAARLEHAKVSVQALKWSGEFAACEDLQPVPLISGIQTAIAEHFSDKPATAVMEPLIFAAMQICPPQG